MSDNGFVEIVEWLFELPADSVVAWNSRHLSAEEPFSTGYVDVAFFDVRNTDGVSLEMATPELAWAVTIENPDNPELDEYDDPTCLPCPYDSQLVMTMKDEHSLGIPEKVIFIGPSGVIDLTEKAHTPWDMEDDLWQRDIYWKSFQGVEPYSFNGKIYEASSYREELNIICPQWSADAISNIVTEWIQIASARDDIVAAYDATGPKDSMLEAAEERLDAIQRGEVDMVDAGGGILIHPDVFDIFGNDLELGVDVMNTLRKIQDKDEE